MNIGDYVYVKPKGKKDYYSGDGRVVSISKLKVQPTPHSRIVVKKMIAVRFSGKGVIWFNPSEVKVRK